MSETLKERIIKEMTVDYSNVLEKNFTLAKKMIKITKNGKVDIINKNKFTGKEQIQLYLIGKLYAKEAGFTRTESVSNKELIEELGMPKGSVDPWTKYLRDHKKIRAVQSGIHTVPVNLLERVLKKMEKKLKK